MHRILGTFVVAALLLGSVAFCQWALTRNVEFSVARGGHDEEPAGAGDAARYELTLTPTFEAVEDPFALRPEDGAAPRLLVRKDGAVALEHTGDVRAGAAVTASNLAWQGESAELYVEGNPSAEDAARPCALRVQVWREGALCDDQTIWSDGGGAKVAATITVRLRPRLRPLDRGLGGAAP